MHHYACMPYINNVVDGTAKGEARRDGDGAREPVVKSREVVLAHCCSVEVQEGQAEVLLASSCRTVPSPSYTDGNVTG